jgi:hypothetical protein
MGITPRIWLTFALAGLGLVSRLAAQATGLPVRSGGVGQGVAVAVDYGVGRINRSSGDDAIRAVAGSVTVGFGPLGLSGTLGRAWIDPATGPDRSQTTAGINAEMVTLGGPLVPFRLLWQAGYARQVDGTGPRPWRGTVGLGASLTIPTVILSIKPWLGPRLEYRGNQPGGSQLRGALSAGIDFGLLNGLGLRVGYDTRLGWDQAAEQARGVSVGVSYQFR